MLGRLCIIAIVTVLGSSSTGCISPSNPTDDEFTGTAARDRILQLTHKTASALPVSAKKFYAYDGGSFNGSMTYWAFDCDSRQDCLSALENLTGIQESELTHWVPSQYAVVMQGPSYYATELSSTDWKVASITKGLVYERVEGDRQMYYYAVDLDRNRVYFHRESGGFPTDRYRP